MATVPTYDLPAVALDAGNVPTFQPYGVQEVKDITNAQIAQQGEQMVKSGIQLKKVSDQISYEIAEATTKGRDNKLSEEFQMEVVGYLQTAGKNSIDKRDEVKRSLQTKINQQLDEIKNPLEKEMFAGVAKRRLEIASGQVDNHFLRETKVYRIGEGKARINRAVDDANIALIAKPDSFKFPKLGDGEVDNPYFSFKKTAVAEANALADIEGMPVGSAQRKELVMATTTALHFSAVKNMVRSDMTTLAAEYLNDAVKAKEIDPDKIDELANLVKVNGEKDQSLQLFLELKAKPEAEAMADLESRFRDKKISASVYDLTRVRIEHYDQQKRQDDAVKIQTVIGAATEFLIKNPGKTVADLPTQMYDDLKRTGHLGSIYNFAKQNRFENDDTTWAKFLTLPQSQMAKMTPEQFYASYRTKLDDAHLERGYSYILAAREAASKPGKDPKQPEHLQIVTTTERVKRAAQTAEIIPWDSNKIDANQAKEYAQFEDAIQAKIRVFEANELGNKRKANDAELQVIIDEVLMDKVKIKKGWFTSDPTKPRAVLSEKDLPDAYVVVGNREIKLQQIKPSDIKRYKAEIDARNVKRKQEGKPPIPATQQIYAEMWASENPER
jgi:hypothetical protein